MALAIPRRSSVREVSRFLDRISISSQEKLIQDARRVLSIPKLARNEHNRIAATKILLATADSNLALITKLLSDFGSQVAYEVHFTLFCFMDLQDVPGGHHLHKKLHQLAAEYLLRVRRATASANWMVGHLLGDHWKTEEALKILSTAARSASFAAGREGALIGLQSCLSWASPVQRKRIVTLLEEVAKIDQSDSVRLRARMALKSRHAAVR